MAKNNEVKTVKVDAAIEKVEAYSGAYITAHVKDDDKKKTIWKYEGKNVGVANLIKFATETPDEKSKAFPDKSYRELFTLYLESELSHCTAKQDFFSLLYMTLTGKAVTPVNYLDQGETVYKDVNTLVTDILAAEKGKRGRKSGAIVTVDEI